jgi:hypothetical protein
MIMPDLLCSRRALHHDAVHHLQRFPLGMAYTVACTLLWVMFAAPLARSLLAGDCTGVDRPVVDLLRRTTAIKERRCAQVWDGQGRGSQSAKGSQARTGTAQLT